MGLVRFNRHSGLEPESRMVKDRPTLGMTGIPRFRLSPE